MKYFLLLVFIFTLNKVMAINGSQSNEFGEGVTKDTVLFTPGGLALKSNIHYINNRHHLSVSDNQLQVVETKTGLVSQKFKKFASDIKSKGLRSNNKMALSTSDFKDGWATYAHCQVLDANPPPIISFSTNWVVPLPPTKKSNQLIYIFNGLGGRKDDVGCILQPVLQWGVSPAGGGDYWAICNWYVTSNEFFYDSLIKVDPGTNLQGLIQLVTTSDSLYTYSSSFLGLTSEFIICNSSALMDPYNVLEIYNLNSCDEYPAQEKLIMSNINIKEGDTYPQMFWSVGNNIVGCGQRTKLVKKSTYHGQVDIYFHTPSSDDYFDVIQISPNPVSDALSIRSLKEIIGCKIEIYNFYGYLLETIPNIDINYDYGGKFTFYYKLNMQSYKQGVYFVKIYYENKSHAFTIIKM